MSMFGMVTSIMQVKWSEGDLILEGIFNTD